MLKLNSSLVSVNWLKEHLYDEDVVILNATIPKVTDKNSLKETQQIPSALFFDLKNTFSDTENRFPNALPTTEKFTIEAQNLGIKKSSIIVVYDDYGFYSCARAWWLFKAFGHQQVAVLDGGLPEWKKNGFPLEEKQIYTKEKGNFIGNLDATYFKFFNDILILQEDDNTVILDARAKDRFDGSLPEPREGLRSGHIPNSLSLPFQQLLSDNTMKTPLELKTIFQSVNPDNNSMVFSCGSGVTACILALGAELAGCKDLSVYDGSWTEYGTLTT